MLELTKPAQEQLEQHFEGKERPSIRVYMAAG